MNLHALIAVDQDQGSNALRTSGSAGARSDTQALLRPAHGVHVNVAGILKIKTLKGKTVSLQVNAGASYSYGIAQVFDTGTTVANSDFSLLYGV